MNADSLQYRHACTPDDVHATASDEGAAGSDHPEGENGVFHFVYPGSVEFAIFAEIFFTKRRECIRIYPIPFPHRL